MFEYSSCINGNCSFMSVICYDCVCTCVHTCVFKSVVLLIMIYFIISVHKYMIIYVLFLLLKMKYDVFVVNCIMLEDLVENKKCII